MWPVRTIGKSICEPVANLLHAIAYYISSQISIAAGLDRGLCYIVAGSTTTVFRIPVCNTEFGILASQKSI